MNNITTRTRILIVTSVLTVAYFALQQVDFRVLMSINLNFDPVKPLLLALIVYLGAYWALFFKISGERFITVLMFPAIGVFAVTLLAELVLQAIFSELGQLSLLVVSAIIFWVFTYVLLLTVNILNASYLQEIPLGQAARAAQYVLSLIISYLIFFILFSNDIEVLIRFAFIALTGFILVYIALWSISMRLQQRFNASAAIGLLLGFISLILSIWPLSAPYLSLVLSLVLYVCLGISLEIRDIISRWIWIEYFALFALIIVLLTTVAEWGINGSLV